MNLRILQSRVEASNASKWESMMDVDAFDRAIECEAEAIAARKLKDPVFCLKLIDADDLELDTVIDAEKQIDWRALIYMVMFGSMPKPEAQEILAKWLAQNRDDIQREARGNIEGDMYDNLYDADDQWSD